MEQPQIKPISIRKRIQISMINLGFSCLLIPLIFQIYYYFKDGQTLGHKFLGYKLVDSAGGLPKTKNLIRRAFTLILQLILFLVVAFMASGFIYAIQILLDTKLIGGFTTLILLLLYVILLVFSQLSYGKIYLVERIESKSTIMSKIGIGLFIALIISIIYFTAPYLKI